MSIVGYLCMYNILLKMADSIKENVKGSELEADERLEEGDNVLIAQALSLSADSTEQGGEINSPFNSEPKIIDDNWQGPTTLFLGQLQEMGFSKNACIKGLYHTQNRSVDEAASWILNNSHIKDIDEPLKIGAEPDLEALKYRNVQHRNPCKMVFVVNSELGMGVGKVAAQVGHATISLHRKMLLNQEDLGHIIMQWEDHGELKIVVKGNNAAHLMDLENQAKQERLTTYLVYDAGRTQVVSGSVTVLGIFGTTDSVDKVTGNLKLL